MLVLLPGIDSRSPRVTHPEIKNQIWREDMCPATAVVSTLRATASGAVLSDRVIDRYAMFCVAEEDVVFVTEAMIDPDLETVRIVCSRTILREVICYIDRKRQIRLRRVSPEKILHRREDQSLRNLETR